MIPVRSSNLEAVGYDPATREMRVRFKKGGQTYVFENIDPKEHDALVGADSVGAHFHNHIRHKKSRRL
jgi:hypothetical protein